MATSIDAPKKKGKHVKLALEIIFFAALMVFAVFYILKDDPATTFSLMGKASFFPLFLAILILLVTLVLDGLNITLLSRLYSGKYQFHQGLVNVCVGQVVGVFLKSGASIIQAYTFTKQEIKSAQAASILTMNYLVFQISLILYSVVMVVFGYPYVKDIPIDLLGGLPLVVICIIAFGVQLVFLGLIIGLGFWRGFHRFVLNTGVDFLAKLHILRNPDATRRKLTLQFATYRVELKRLFHNIPLVIVLFTSNLLKRFLLGIIPYIIFWSLNADLSNLSFAESLFGTGYVDVVASFINVGAPEIMFQSSYTYFLGGQFSSLASAANLLWRSVTFYLLFIIGLLTLLLYRGAPKRHELLSNTATIYDLEIANIQEDESTRTYLDSIYKPNSKRRSLLTPTEVNESFRRIRENILGKTEEATEVIQDKDLTTLLEEQRKHLAKIQTEVAKVIEKEKPDAEIQMEAKQDMEIHANRQKRKDLRKRARLDRKRMKAQKKLQEDLLRMQPSGTTMKEDEQHNLHFSSDDEVTEISAMPSSVETKE